MIGMAAPITVPRPMPIRLALLQGSYKVLRGGSWDDYDYYLRVAYRYYRPSDVSLRHRRVPLCGPPGKVTF